MTMNEPLVGAAKAQVEGCGGSLYASFVPGKTDLTRFRMPTTLRDVLAALVIFTQNEARSLSVVVNRMVEGPLRYQSLP